MIEPALAAVAPLQGRRIVVTRAQEQAGDFVVRLRELGGEPLEYPAIAIAPPESYAPLDAAIARLAAYAWVVFTSVNGVAAFHERLARAGRDAAVLQSLRLGAIGPATAAAVARLLRPPDFVPDTYVAEAIVAQIGDVTGSRVLLPRADIARAALAEGLRARGATVEEITAYRTVPAPGLAGLADLLRAGAVDALTLTSSSTVRYTVAGLEAAGFPVATLAAAPARPAICCIGPITAETAHAAGLPVDAVAAEYTTAGLVAALVRLFSPSPEGKNNHD